MAMERRKRSEAIWQHGNPHHRVSRGWCPPRAGASMEEEEGLERKIREVKKKNGEIEEERRSSAHYNILLHSPHILGE